MTETKTVVAAASVAINDQTYELSRHTGAWHLTKPDGTRYDLMAGVCNCQASLYNGKARDPVTGGCKHMRALRQLGFLTLAEDGRPPEPPMKTAEEVQTLLAAPFDPSEVKAKPAVVTGSQALAMFYVDARVIQDRLDEVLGIDGWQDEYEVLEGGSVKCKLRCRIGGAWVAKSDVGSPSEQPDDGDKMKAAFSDALKRAAVKFGVGRYLYRVPAQWEDYDPQRRQFARKPQLPGAPKPPRKKEAPAPTEPPRSVDGGGTITTAQGNELKALLAKHEVPWENLAKHYAIKRLGELPAVHFEDARTLIQAPQSVLKRKEA